MKILSATHIPEVIDDSGLVTPATICVEVEVKGLPCSVGGIDPEWSKQEIREYLRALHDEILSVATNNAKERSTSRPDLEGMNV